MMPFEIIEANLNDPEHQRAIVHLVNQYACDVMGGGKPLSAGVQQALIPALQNHPTTLVFLAYDGVQAVGVAVCFLGFSTFAAQPLINIHDLAVLPEYRGRGIGRRLLQEVEGKARELGCCKLTLEVRVDNLRAKRIYENVGFAGDYLFLSKGL
jgi:ribosomal protein S18 acetylase RimI-like enzyme